MWEFYSPIIPPKRAVVVHVALNKRYLIYSLLQGLVAYLAKKNPFYCIFY